MVLGKTIWAICNNEVYVKTARNHQNGRYTFRIFHKVVGNKEGYRLLAESESTYILEEKAQSDGERFVRTIRILRDRGLLKKLSENQES